MLSRLVKDTVMCVLNQSLLTCQFRHELGRTTSIEDCLDLAYDFHNRVRIFPASKRWIFDIHPGQIREEITGLLEILTKHSPKLILEIGTANGGTLFLLTMVSRPDATIISIDLPGGLFGGGYPAWKIPLFKSFVRYRQRIHLVLQDSHKLSTLNLVEGLTKGRRLDLLFIDGDHRYIGVKRDFEMYAPLVRKEGIIAFHDIVPGPQDNVGGVPRFWQEIRDNHNYIEIVKDWNQGGFGIGVVKAQNPSLCPDAVQV